MALNGLCCTDVLLRNYPHSVFRIFVSGQLCHNIITCNFGSKNNIWMFRVTTKHVFLQLSYFSLLWNRTADLWPKLEGKTTFTWNKFESKFQRDPLRGFGRRAILSHLYLSAWQISSRRRRQSDLQRRVATCWALLQISG